MTSKNKPKFTTNKRSGMKSILHLSNKKKVMIVDPKWEKLKQKSRDKSMNIKLRE